MTAPTWTILIPTLGQRGPLFARLLDALLPQLPTHGGAVRVLAWWNNGSPRLADIRQALVHAVRTDYLSFVDDDDLVPDYFVDEVIQALASRPDYVGWRTLYHVDGEPNATVYHSLRHRRWHQDRHGIYRDITHLNPVRTELAGRADFRRARPGRAEDRVWVDQMRPHVRTEVYIDRVMYLYLWSPAVTAWQHPDRISRGPYVRPVIDSPHFAYHPESADA